MQGIYTYIPETNYVPREYSVAAVLLLLFMMLISLVPVLNLLCFYISTFRSMCTVLNVAVFCSSLTSWFPGMLLTYFLNDFELLLLLLLLLLFAFWSNETITSPCLSQFSFFVKIYSFTFSVIQTFHLGIWLPVEFQWHFLRNKYTEYIHTSQAFHVFRSWLIIFKQTS
jgi:hypothetical protein